jgi:serine/threonine-protein kinase RsbW
LPIAHRIAAKLDADFITSKLYREAIDVAAHIRSDLLERKSGERVAFREDSRRWLSGNTHVFARRLLRQTMRTCLQDGSVEFVIPSDLNEARHLQELIEKQLRQYHYEEREVFGIRLALEEALVNAIKHGNQMDEGKRVYVRYRILLERFDVGVTDEGPGYDPGDVPDPLSEENLERPSGRGLFLMRHYMTEVVVHAPGNRLTMSKVRKKPYLNGVAK